MNVLDPNLGESLDRYIENKYWFDHSFKSRAASVMVIDPKGDFPLKDIEYDGLYVKYFDLSECSVGDYNRIGKFINQYVANGESMIDGLMFDNIDRLPQNSETEDLEQMITSALKRDDDLQMLPSEEPIPFNKMMIAVRCNEYPEYLKGKSLQTDIIEA